LELIELFLGTNVEYNLVFVESLVRELSAEIFHRFVTLRLVYFRKKGYVFEGVDEEVDVFLDSDPWRLAEDLNGYLNVIIWGRMSLL
jgi:hypothetical protein